MMFTRKKATPSPRNAGRGTLWVPGTQTARAGFSLLEMFVSVVVFGAVLVTFLPLTHAVREQQRATDQHLLALREAENLLEVIATRSWSELTNDTLAKLKMPDAATSRLPNVEWNIDVAESSEPPASKRVAVIIRWGAKPTQPVRSVQLAAWFTKPEAQP